MAGRVVPYMFLPQSAFSFKPLQAPGARREIFHVLGEAISDSKDSNFSIFH